MTSFTANDERLMRLALQLAARGEGLVEPNPMVGCVIATTDGRVIGEGYHERFGGPHAEVHALAAAGPASRGATLYVTLEPCCHFGKTPPCTDAVVQAGIRRVVAAMPDPSPHVAGGGLARLQAAGLQVDSGLCADEAAALNAPYLKRLATGTPWVIAKWAMSLDGKIATRTGQSQWISNARARARSHQLRGRVDAIVVGRGTVRADDPLLTARPPGPRQATRVVLTASGDLPQRCRLLDSIHEAPVLVFTTREAEPILTPWAQAGAEVVVLPTMTPAAILADLGRRQFTNVLLEGGAGVIGSFLDAQAIDEAWVVVAPKVLGGTAAPGPVGGLGCAALPEAVELQQLTVEDLEGNWLLRGRVARRPTQAKWA